MIRWKAVIPIVVSVLVLGAGYIFFFDNIVTKALIVAGQEATGARVDIRSSKLTFSPFGLQLNGIEVADPDKPMTNIFEADNVVAAIDLALLLEKKIVVETVQVSGLELGTDRKISGALKKKKSRASEKQENETESDEVGTLGIREKLQDVKLDEMLDKEPLAIEKEQQRIQESINQKEKKYKNLIESTDYSKQFNDIKKELESVSKVKVESVEDIKKVEDAIKTVQGTQKKIDALKNTIISQKKQLDRDIATLKQDILGLQKVGEKDYNRLLSTLDVGSISQGNVSQTLLNSTLKTRVEQFVVVWERVSRLFPEEKEDVNVLDGITVEFPTPANPVPSLWIKKILVSGVFQGTELTGTIRDITSEQDTLNKPTSYTFKTVAKQNAAFDFNLNGTSDFRSSEPVHRIGFTYNNVPLPRLPLTNMNGKEIVLEKGVSNTKGDILVTGKQLKGRLVTFAESLEFSPKTKTKRATDLGAIMVNVLQDVSTAKVVTTLSGSVFQPGIAIESDIDDVLSKATKKAADEQVAEYKKALKEKVDQKVNKVKSQLQKELSASMGEFGKQVSKDVNQINSLDDLSKSGKAAAQNQIDDYKDEIKRQAEAEKARLKQEKEKAEAAARKKAAEEKAKLDAEIAKQKAAAKKAAEEEKKRLEEEAKKQANELLKGLF
jgi:uncharacterized protein (TIGR03545 family)